VKRKLTRALAVLCLLPGACRPQVQPKGTVRSESSDYARLQQRLRRGWNTWDVQSVTTQVLLPQGLAVRVGFLDKHRLTGEGFLPTAFIGKLDPKSEHVFPGPHRFNGSYTELKLTWKGQSFRVQSATESDDLGSGRPSPACWRGTAGGLSIATCRAILCGVVIRTGSRKTWTTIHAVLCRARDMNRGWITLQCMTM